MDQIRSFLANPHFSGEFRKPSLRELFLLLVGYFLIVIPIGVLLLVLSEIFDLSTETLHVSYYQRVVYGLLLGPFVEEIFFRLIYVFTKRNLLVIMITSFGFAVFFFIKTEPFKAYMIFAVFILASLLLLFFSRTSRFFNNYFKVFFYGVAITFAFLHVFNFSGLDPSKYILTFFIVMPQFILGILLGFVRLTYGFIFAVGFHMVVNLSIIF